MLISFVYLKLEYLTCLKSFTSIMILFIGVLLFTELQFSKISPFNLSH